MTHGPYDEVIKDGAVFDRCTVCGYLIYRRPA